jgi:CelD/BcsL family acetyltransferase involved in cellulose biosynthesis
MTIELRTAKTDDAKEWNNLILQSPHGTPFHTWNWLKITEKHTYTKLYPLIGIQNDTPVGLFPLFFQKNGPIRMVFSPPPHAAIPSLGPVLLGYDTLRQAKWESRYVEFQKSVDNFISEELQANYVSISLPPGLGDPRPYTWSGYSADPHFDYQVDLSKGIERLYKSLNNRQRSDLAKAEKLGMTMELGSKNEYDSILDLLDVRYAEQGKIITVSREYFHEIYNTFKDDIKIIVINVDGKAATGLIFLRNRDSLLAWVGNPKPKNRISPSPNHLLYWESVKYASEQKFTYFSVMGAAGDVRLHEFYASRFNPDLKIRYDVSQYSFSIGMLEKGYANILKPLRAKIRYSEMFKKIHE